MRQGELSAPQTDTITDAAAVNPSAEQELVRAAKRESLPELRDRCARTKAAARDAEEHHKQIHAARTCQKRSTAEGAGEILYRSTLDEVAEIWAIMQGYGNAEFHRARLEGRREPHDAYLADGLLGMARAAARTATGRSTTGNATSDNASDDASTHDTPQEDHGDAAHGIETADGGRRPVPLKLIAHLGRRPTAHQITALEWRDPVCTAEGCNRVVGLQNDHREDWAGTKITLLALLDRLCDHHHELKTTRGWKLVSGTGKRPMVPPGHPRHPDTHPPPEQHGHQAQQQTA